MFDLENVSKHFKLYFLYHNFTVNEPTVVHYFDDIQIIIKCVFNLCFEAMRSFVSFLFRDLKNYTFNFFKVTPIIIFVWFSILGAFSIIKKPAR